MTTTEQPPAQGLIAGKYQLVRMIGRGGMGSVWEARHVSLGTSSAIKFIESEYADSQEARSRFDKEAKAAATIQSKHAIQIYDHGVTEDGKPYIVMELLQGEPLDKRIERLGRLSLQDTARIIQQVCRGLARAHERGIIHRDLKPENIFLVRTIDDDDDVAKVLDFGIAKISTNGMQSSVTSSTKTGAVLGTPFFMSPEQARGLRNVDHRTDVWSLGVIAYKCVTGVLPFDGESVGDLLVKICTAPIPMPSQTAPGLSSNFDAWFFRALEREPDRRFATVTELADALCFAAGLPVRGVQSGPGAGGPVPVGPGMTTPFQGYGGSNPSRPDGTPIAHGFATPPAGAMTNAPFTSETASGVPTGKKGLVAGAVVAGLLALGAAAGVVYTMKKSTPTTVQASSSTEAPSAAAALAPAAPVAKDTPADHEQADAGVTAPASPAVETAKAAAATPIVAAKPAAKPVAPPTPAPVVVPKASAKPAEPPHDPPPAPVGKPPRKKPISDDPGY